MKNYRSNILSDSYFCIDIETTGLDPTAEDAEIIEIYIKIMKNNKKIKEFYAKYWADSWEKTKEIHKIGFEEIKDAPRFKLCHEDKEFIKNLFLRCANPNDTLTFMAHYAPFEFNWFFNMLDLTEEEKTAFKKIRTCDPRLISKNLFPEDSHSLINMCKKMGVGFPVGQHDFHRADQDVNAMWELFLKIKDIIDEKDMTEYDTLSYYFDFEAKHN